jgi:hypothetical protein
METYPVTAAQDGISGDFQQVLHWTLKDNRAHTILIQLLTLPGFFLFGAGFSLMAKYVGRLPGAFSLGIWEAAIMLAATVAGIVMTIVLHEWVHGLSMLRYGARPIYGVLPKQLMFYATSPGYAFRRNSYILIALAPQLALGALAILGMVLLQGTYWVALLALCATINGSGAFGDIWLVSLVLRYPKTAYVVDEKDGVRVLMLRA